MKTLLAALPLATCLVGPVYAETNRLYITDERKTSYDETPFSSEQIERARHAQECQPAEQDPRGHGGPVQEGFQLSIRFDKQSFSNGEPVTACVILRNVSDRLLRFAASYYGSDKDIKLVLMKGEERVYGNNEPKPGATFAERLRYLRNGSVGSWPLEPRTQRKFSLDLGKIFDLTTNGEYVVRAMRMVPTLDKKSEIQVVSGKAPFRITGSTNAPAPHH